MKKLFLSALFLLSYHTFGAPTEEEIRFCQNEGKRYGDGSGRDELPVECEGHFFKMARPQAFKKSSTQDLEVFGFKNIVFIKDLKSKKNRQNIISGLYTELKDVVSVAIDETHKEIAILERSGDILFFSSLITGNVAPLRILRSQELQGSHEIAICPDSNEILALNNSAQSILVYSRSANIHGRDGNKNLTLKKRLKNIQGEMLGYSSHNQELLVLSSDKKKIHFYQDKKFIKSLSLGTKSAERMDYSKNKIEIIVTGSNKIEKISLTATDE